MPKYAVGVREIRVITVVVDAETPEEAVSKADSSAANGTSFEVVSDDYGNTMPTHTWSVAEWDEKVERIKGKTFYHNDATGKFDKTIG